MRMPVQQLAVGLDGDDHARQGVVSRKRAADFIPHASPRAGGELAQQLAVEAGVQPQTLRDGQNHLPVRDGKTDLFGHVHRGQQRPLLVAGRARRTLLAGKGDEHLVSALKKLPDKGSNLGPSG